MTSHCILWRSQCASGTDCIIFHRKDSRFTGKMVIRSPSVALAFQKLYLAAIHEHGKWHNHFQCTLGLRDGRDLLMAEFSPVK